MTVDLSQVSSDELRAELERRKAAKPKKQYAQPFVKDKLAWARGELAKAEAARAACLTRKPKDWREGKTKDESYERLNAEVSRWRRIVEKVEREQPASQRNTNKGEF